jgi:hypothetical protein
MSKAVQRRRGTTAQHATFTGRIGETTVDTDKHVVVVHDGSTAGGFPLAKYSDFNALRILRNQFSQTSSVAISNTNVETETIGSGVGSAMIPAGYLATGDTLEVNFSGNISGLNNNTATLRIYFGGTKIIESVGIMPVTFTNSEFRLKFSLTYRGNNKFIGNGFTTIFAGQAFATTYFRPLLMTAEATIDATQANTLSTTYQWGTASASNSLVITNGTIDTLC